MTRRLAYVLLPEHRADTGHLEHRPLAPEKPQSTE
jgi:hypothetical protein